jgi:penicillin-binding protein 1A
LRIGDWSPQDFDRTFRGPVTLEDALAQSLNTVAVRLLQAVGGPQTVIEVARRLGITDPLPDDPSLALGTGEVGLLEMTAAYATMLNGGFAVRPSAIEHVWVHGRTLALQTHAPVRVIDPANAAALKRMMAAVVTRGSGRVAAVPGRAVEGKTGTTQDYRDAWFIGETGGTVIGVWLGNDDDKPMRGVTGGSLPARLFHEIATALPP